MSGRAVRGALDDWQRGSPVTPRRPTLPEQRDSLSTHSRPAGLIDGRHGGFPMARQRFDIGSKWLLHNQG
jgi:hypothetical protein